MNDDEYRKIRRSRRRDDEDRSTRGPKHLRNRRIRQCSRPLHRLGPVDVSFEAERFRHRAIATHHSPGRQHCRRGPGRAGRAAAAARCRVSPDPLRLARPRTARSRPRLRPRQPRSRDPAVSPPEHRSQECPRPQQLSLAEQMVDGGAHERYGLIAISTPSPLPRRRTPRRSVDRPSGCPRRRNISLTSARSLLSAATLGSRWRCTSATPSAHSGLGPPRIITGSFGNPVGHPRSRAQPNRRASARQTILPSR